MRLALEAMKSGACQLAASAFMAVLDSKVDLASKAALRNRAYCESLLQDLRQKLMLIVKGGPESARKKHLARNKMLVRDRIDKLLDPGSPFLELSPMAAFGMYHDEAPAAGIITGIGLAHDAPVMVIANDPTVKGGSYFPLTVKKHLRAQEIALENRLPCLYLVDSGGAFLPLQAEIFPDKEHFGRIFYHQARLSSSGIAQIALVLGPCTIGGAYIPAMSDEVVVVKNQGTIILNRPSLAKPAAGEDISTESSGGGEAHTCISGAADYLAENDQHALDLARAIVQRFPRQKLKQDAFAHPKYPLEDIYSIVSQDPHKSSCDVREIIARLVDGSDFHEFKRFYGPTLVTGFATIYGVEVGILANNGILSAESAKKGTHFIELCGQRQIPLLFLQHITGFMVGQSYGNEDIAKDGAKMIMAVACAKVPKYTVIIGGSFGAGNYAMCGRASGPRFLWTWPNAKISAMGKEQAANTLLTIRKDALVAQGKSLSQEEEEALVRPIIEKYDREGHPYYATARLWDDGIIDPKDTRRILGLALSFADLGQISRFGVFRM